MAPRPPISHVDSRWLADEAALMASEHTPRFPLLIGGAGLIGCNMLVLLAHSPGCERVRVLDMRPPSPVVLSDAGIPDSKIEFVKHVLGTDSEESLAASLDGIDCVFSMVTPPVQLGTAEDFQRTNVLGVERLVSACLAKGVPRLVFLSSIAVSNHLVESLEWNEDVPLPPLETYLSFYDLTKRKGEEIVLAANKPGVLQTVALRPGGVMLSPHDFTFRNLFIMKGYFIAPSGTKKVDFIDGRDVCRGLLLAAQALKANKGGVAGEAFWLTKGEAIDTFEVARLANEFLGWRLITVPMATVQMARFFKWIQYQLMRCFCCKVPGFPPHLFMKVCQIEQTFDNAKITRVLGYRPKVSIAEAVGRICQLYRREHGLAT